MTNNYYIEGASDVKHTPYNLHLPSYPSFQSDLQKFKDLLLKLEFEKKGASFVHFGDGDYFFLKKGKANMILKR